MTQSNEFIAIRKATRSERDARLEHATPAIKRSFILEDASHSRRVAKLERLNLLQRNLGPTDDVFSPPRRSAGGFTRLGYLAPMSSTHSPRLKQGMPRLSSVATII